MAQPDIHSPIYDHIFGRCGPFVFPGPWAFLRPDPDVRGPVSEPAAALAELLAKFGEQVLAAAGVLEPAPGGPRLRQGLVEPASAVVALRRQRSGPPFCLMTADGCLPQRFGIAAALADGFTRRLLVCGRHLFAVANVVEAALLRALRFPAALVADLPRPGLRVLEFLDERFGREPDDLLSLPDSQPPAGPSPQGPGQAAPDAASEAPDPAGPAPDPEAGGAAPGRGTACHATCDLVLVSWSPLALAAAPPPVMCAIGDWLHEASRNLPLEFYRVAAWQADEELIALLRYLLPFRRRSLVREVLDGDSDSASTSWGKAPSAAPTFAGALAKVTAALADGRRSPAMGESLRRATAAYSEVVERDLIEPLLAEALASDDPVIRNGGVQLACIVRQLHALAPELAYYQQSYRSHAAAEDTGFAPEAFFRQYLALVARFVSLSERLAHWRSL